MVTPRLRMTAFALVAVAAVLTGPMRPAEAAYTASCLDGTVAPQLCTLVTAIAGSSFGPRDTGATVAHLTRRTPTEPAHPCSDPSQAFPREEYAGAVTGSIRGFPSARGTVVTRLTGCRNGVLLIESSTNATGAFLTASGHQRRLTYSLTASTYRLAPTAAIQIELRWSTTIADCTRPGDVSSCTSIYRENTPFCEFSDDCYTKGPLTLRNTGVAADAPGQALVTRGSTQTTEHFRYAVAGSVSGRWSRLQLSWRDGAFHDLRVTTAPESIGWRVQHEG